MVALHALALALANSLLFTSSLAAPHDPNPVPPNPNPNNNKNNKNNNNKNNNNNNNNNNNVWRISEFGLRRPDGRTPTSIGFRVQAASGPPLDFYCAATDSTGKVLREPLKDGKLYRCGQNSPAQFSWEDREGRLVVKQTVSDKFKLLGSTRLPLYCRAGGNGRDDRVCQATGDAFIQLYKD